MFFIPLKNGERINPASFDLMIKVEDPKLPSSRKSNASLATYKKHFNVEHGTCPVPVAQFSKMTDYEPPSPMKCSTEYRRHIPKTPEDYENIVEYDYDDEDCNWLQLLNAEKKQKKEHIELDDFEFVMDRLEKECVFEVKPSASMVPGSSLESDDVCCVCCDGETTNANQIIYCDMCNIAVHQDCYGVPYIPEGQWLCRRCKLSPSTPVECCLCPNTTGAFKQTSDGRWAHVICAIWLNEVHFGNAVFLEPIEGVDNSLKKRSKLKCLVCRQKMGACLQCSTRSCIKAFHVTCAQNSGMSMRVVSVEDPEADDGMDVKRFIYCHLHIDDDDSRDMAARKKRMENALRNARRAMANSTDNTVNINMPVVLNSVLNGIRKRVGFNISDIVQYWYLKRKSRCGAPLIRRIQLQLSTKRTSASDHLTEEHRQLYTAVSRMRIQWENTRLLCELVKKREKYKNAHFELCKELTEGVIRPLTLVLDDIVDQLIKKDKANVFTSPVNVDGYRTVIKRPMDLSTLRKKIDQGIMDTFEDFRIDFDLMMNNCDKFNENNAWYLQYGKKFRKMGNIVIAEEERRHTMREAIINDSEFTSSFSAIGLYDSLLIEENKEDNDAVKNMRSLRSPNSGVPQTPPSQSRRNTSNALQSKTFYVSTPAVTKRKGDLFTPPTARVKRQKKEDGQTPKQTSITNFFTPNRPDLRSSATPAPLMAYRDNSAVRSPLPTDIASSESSADEEDGRRNRRSARLQEHLKSDPQFGSDSEGILVHNDLVFVDGTAGRVIDPAHVLLEDQLPKQLISECRTTRRDARVCVMLFGTENKWGWYPSSDIKVMNLSGDNEGVSLSSQKLAKQWYKKIIEYR